MWCYGHMCKRGEPARGHLRPTLSLPLPYSFEMESLTRPGLGWLPVSPSDPLVSAPTAPGHEQVQPLSLLSSINSMISRDLNSDSHSPMVSTPPHRDSPSASTPPLLPTETVPQPRILHLEGRVQGVSTDPGECKGQSEAEESR